MELPQIINKIQKDQKPNCHFWRAGSRNTALGANAGGWACLHSTPPKGWANHLSHPSAHPLNTPLPLPCGKNQLIPTPHLGDVAREPLTWFCSPLLYECPRKTFPDLLFWSRINFYWLRRPRSLVSNNNSLAMSLGLECLCLLLEDLSRAPKGKNSAI